MTVQLLDRIQQLFSTRELASILWVCILFASTLFSKNILESYKGILKAFFVKSIIVMAFLISLYLTIQVQIITFWISWDFDLIKELVYWVLFALVPLLYQSSKIRRDPFLFKKILRETFSGTIIIEFIVSEYPFNFWIEFFVILPLTIFLFGLLHSDKKDNTEQFRIRKFFSISLSVIGLILLSKASFEIIASFSKLPILKWMVIFLLPLYLTVTFIPVIYLISLFSRLENILRPLRHLLKFKEPRKILGNALFRLHLRLDLLEGYKDELIKKNIRSEDEAIIELLRFRNNVRRHQINRNIPLSKGWGINDSKFYLSDFDLELGLYKNDELGWYAISEAKEFASAPFTLNNNISYYCYGDEFAVNKLELMININSYIHENEALGFFETCCKELFRKAFLFPMTQEASFKLLSKGDYIEEILENIITINTTFWPENRGYDIKFNISTKL